MNPTHFKCRSAKVVSMTSPNGKALAHATRVKWFISVKALFGLGVLGRGHLDLLCSDETGDKWTN